MATVYGALGQSKPGATTLTDIYTVPSSKHATVRVISCNQGTAAVIRISLAPAGAADAVAQYIAYDQALSAVDALTSAPVTVAQTDVIRVYSDTGGVSFTVTGIEQDD